MGVLTRIFNYFRKPAIQRPAAPPPPVNASSWNPTMSRRAFLAGSATVVGLGLTAYGGKRISNWLGSPHPQPIEPMSSSPLSQSQLSLIKTWWKTHVQTVPVKGQNNPISFVIQETDKNTGGLKVVSEGIPWGLASARHLNSQDRFDQVLRGLRLMMRDGLPSWNNLLKKEPAQNSFSFETVDSNPAMDADLQIVAELIQAARLQDKKIWGNGEFDYAKIAQHMLNMLYDSYVSYDGAFASLAPNPHEKGGAQGYVKNLSYISIAILEVIRDFDANTSHQWNDIINFEQISRNKIISAKEYHQGETAAVNAPITRLPDWVRLGVEQKYDNGSYSNEYKIFIDAKRSSNFGYEAIRCLWLIAQDGLYARDPEIQKQNQELAKFLIGQILALAKSQNKPPEEFIAEIEVGSEKNKEPKTLYAGYAALAYAASFLPQKDQAADYAALSKNLAQKAQEGGTFHGRYYQDSLILFSSLMLKQAFHWQPQQPYVNGESKDSQNILRKYWPYPFFHLKFTYYLTAHQRALLGLANARAAVYNSYAWAGNWRRSRVTNHFRNRITYGQQLALFGMVEGAIEQFTYILKHADPGRNLREIREAAYGLEGSLRRGGIPAFKAVRIYEQIIEERSQNKRSSLAYLYVGLAQAYLETYSQKFLFLALANARIARNLSNAPYDNEAYVKACFLFAVAHQRKGEHLLNNIGKEVSIERVKTFIDANKIIAEFDQARQALIKALEIINTVFTEQNKLSLLGYFDHYLSIDADLYKDLRRCGSFRAALFFQIAELDKQKADAFSQIVGLTDQQKIDQKNAYKSAREYYCKALEDKDITPNLCLSSISKIIDTYREEADYAIKNSHGIPKGRPLTEPAHLRELNAHPAFREAQRLMTFALTSFQNPPAKKPEKIDRDTPWISPEEQAITIGTCVIKDGTPQPKWYDQLLRETNLQDKKRAYELRLAELTLRNTLLGIVAESAQPQEAMRITLNEVNKIIRLSPLARVRSHYERLAFYLGRGQILRVKKELESILTIATILEAGLNSLPAQIFDEKTEDFLKTLSFTSRAFLATGNAILPELKKHLAHLGLTGISDLPDEEVKPAAIKLLLKKMHQLKVAVPNARVRTLLDKTISLLNEASKNPEGFELIAIASELAVEENVILKHYKNKTAQEIALEAVELKKAKGLLASLEKEFLSLEKTLQGLQSKVADLEARGEIPYTADWFERILGVYISTSWSIYKSEPTIAIATMLEVLNQDHVPIKSSEKTARTLINFMRDKEVRGFMNILMQSPYYQLLALSTVAQMLFYSGSETEAKEIYDKMKALDPNNAQTQKIKALIEK